MITVNAEFVVLGFVIESLSVMLLVKESEPHDWDGGENDVV
jgi:hypothetical protein